MLQLIQQMDASMQGGYIGSAAFRREESEGERGESQIERAARLQEQWRRLEIPTFGGDEDVKVWVHEVECYFRIWVAMEDEKLEMVLVYLKGKTLGRFNLWE